MSGKIEQTIDQYFLPRELLAKNRKSDGKFYHTWKACLKREYWPQGQPFYAVIKEIPKAHQDIYRTLSSLSHPNLEKIYHIIEDEDCCCTVNEYIMPPSRLFTARTTDSFCHDSSLSLEQFLHDYQGSLYGKVLSFEERIRQGLIILLQLTEALEVLHAHRLIHGDIHPGNILLTNVPAGYQLSRTVPCDFCVKLIDFDNTAAPKEADHMVTRLMGSKPFAAPEILDFSHPLDKSDIYSLGCILHYTICGESPKSRGLNQQLLQNKWINRIIRRCTASYEARYRNITALKKDLLQALRIPSTPFTRVLYKIPGFRSHTPWKMGVASYIYFSLILTATVTFISIIQEGLPLQEWQKLNLYTILLFIIEIIILTDAFQTGRHSSSYHYFKNSHMFLHICLKIIAAIFVFLLFALLISL